MKRFVTYLYECERGTKIKNVGFIRINVRGSETSMEVYIRNFPSQSGEGNIYGLTYKEEMETIDLGEIKLENGQSDKHISFMTEDIMGSGVSINNIVGIGIRFKDKKYIASCWKDAYAEEVVRGEFPIEISNKEKQDYIEQKESLAVAENTNYEKIDLSQIRDLPSPNWHLATNSFLVHGFWNYGYLVLKKEMEKGEEILSLGVPGIFEKPEAVMAILFGFPNFESISPEMVAVEKEKNQEAEDGTFGCWFVRLKI